MAVMTIYTPLVFAGGVGVVTVANASQITIVTGSVTQNYYGSGFTYSGSTVTGGTVTSTDLYDSSNGGLQYNVTGLSHSAVTIASYVNSGNAFGLRAYLLNGDDTVYGSSGIDNLSGYGGTNIVYGGGGNDTIFGGVNFFADTLYGGTGNDFYSLSSGGFPVIVEYASEGTDVVESYFSGYVLPENVETLLLGANAQAGTGNAGANLIVGNDVGNFLQGMGGNDTLQGGYGSDTLDGGEGADLLQGGALQTVYIIDNPLDVISDSAFLGDEVIVLFEGYVLPDNLQILTLGGTVLRATGNGFANTISGNSQDNTLDGGAGADTLSGGAGNDRYLIDRNDDVVVEQPGAGLDTVVTAVTYVLPVNVENLVLTGTGDLTGTGNESANILSGNAGNNTLDGAGGADILAGGPGNDLYVIDSPGDQVMELGNSGIDTVRTTVTYDMMQAWHVENMSLYLGQINGYGNWLDNFISGSSSANLIDGGRGNDTLSGWIGNDTLIGGLGDDVLVWDDADGSVQGGAGVDTLLVEGGGITLNLTLIADTRITDVEIIDITGTGNNTLTLALPDVLAISSTTDVLTVNGDAGDIVNLQGAWVNGGGTGYTVFTQGQAMLLVDSEISVVV